MSTWQSKLAFWLQKDLTKPPLLKWRKPVRVARAEYRAEVGEMHRLAPRILLISAVTIALFYVGTRMLPGEIEFPWDRLILVVLGISGVGYLHLWLGRFIPVEYRLNEACIYWISAGQASIVRWALVGAAWLGPHPLVPEARQVTFHLTTGRRARIVLPEDESSRAIINAIHEHATLVEREEELPPPPPPPLAPAETRWLAGVTVLYLIGFTYALYYLPVRSILPAREWMFLLFFIVVGLFGPGTLGCLWLARRDWSRMRALLVWAYAMNMAALMTALVLMAIILWLKANQ